MAKKRLFEALERIQWRRKVVPVDFAIIPSLSINGFEKGSVNHLSLNLLQGYSYELEGVALSLGGHWTDNNLVGVQSSLAFNHVGHIARGGQLTLGFNNVGGRLEGFQTSVGANLVAGELHGAQLALAPQSRGGRFAGVAERPGG